MGTTSNKAKSANYRYEPLESRPETTNRGRSKSANYMYEPFESRFETTNRERSLPQYNYHSSPSLSDDGYRTNVPATYSELFDTTGFQVLMFVVFIGLVFMGVKSIAYD
ncbi:hypothetical protein TWF281_011114 [Arthrobotrys megalospora]